jgi:hypothetical protein
MTDADLRALAVKLLKHYAADQDPAVEEIIASRPLDRAPAKVVPLITKEQRALLDMLGGGWADIHEGKAVALIAQGCGGCSAGDDDDGGGSGAEGGPAEGGPEGGDAPDGGPEGGPEGGPATGGPEGGKGGPEGGPAGAPAGGAAQGGDPADAFNESMGWGKSDGTPDESVTSLTSFDPGAFTPDAPENAPETDESPEFGPPAPEVGPPAPDSGFLGSLGRGFGELFGIGPAAAGPISSWQLGSNTATQNNAISAGAKDAASKGNLSDFLNNHPDPAVMATWMNSHPNELADLAAANSRSQASQTQASQFDSSKSANPTGGAVLGNNGPQTSTYGITTGDRANLGPSPYGTLGDPAALEAAGQIAPIGSTISGLTSGLQAATPGSISNPVTLGYEAPTQTYTAPPVSTLGPLDDETKSPLTDAERSSLANSQFQAANVNDAQKNQQDQLNSLLDSISVGLPSNTTAMGNTGTSTTAAPSTSAQPTNMPSTSYTQSPSTVSNPPSDGMPNYGGSGSDGVGGSLYIPSLTPAALVASTTPVATAVEAATPSTQESVLRKYLGAASNPYTYGAGAERTYYSAEGGMFDADKYFADGGLVAPAQPPATSTAPPYPTMAFTDGGGAVGSIAQPPGMVASDAFGSDAPHASPMAPSIAASVPTVQPALQTLASRNTNASPAPSPIAQNPNVDYSFGMSPLSQL